MRELHNLVEYAVNICQDRQILPQHLPGYLTEAPSGGDVLDKGEPSEPSLQFSVPTAHESLGPEQAWEDVERRMIMEALVKAGGRRSKAADILGWGRSTLWRKMKQYGM